MRARHPSGLAITRTNKLSSFVVKRTNAKPLKLAPREIQEKLVARGITHDARTLRRRLAELVAQGDLVSEGAGPATRYSLRSPSINKLQLSPEGDALLQKVSAPISERQASRFEREFVTGYAPNKTYFLPETLRARLLDRSLELRLLEMGQHAPGLAAVA